MSVAIGLPLLLVGLTTFFIAHDKSLGTREIIIPVTLGEGAKRGAQLEIRSSATVGDEQWIGTPMGVFRLDAARATYLEGSPNDEIRDILVAGESILLAGKKSLWRYDSGKSTAVHKGDCWQLATSNDGYTAACKELGLLVSADGKRWQPLAVEFFGDLPSLAGGTPLQKIILDIHTGKFFFGKQYEWIWIDLLRLACVALGLTGLVMWMRGRRVRARGYSIE